MSTCTPIPTLIQDVAELVKDGFKNLLAKSQDLINSYGDQLVFEFDNPNGTTTVTLSDLPWSFDNGNTKASIELIDGIFVVKISRNAGDASCPYNIKVKTNSGTFVAFATGFLTNKNWNATLLYSSAVNQQYQSATLLFPFDTNGKYLVQTCGRYTTNGDEYAYAKIYMVLVDYLSG